MFRRIAVRPGLTFAARRSLPFIPLLLILLWQHCARAGNIQAQQVIQEVTTLETGKTLTRDLSGGEEHNYELALGESQHATVIVRQRGVDVVVLVLAAQGRVIASFDSEYRSDGEETVELIAQDAENCRFRVRASAKNAPSGQYEIRIIEIRAATNNDRLVHDARKLKTGFEQALVLGQYADALKFIERALSISESVLGSEHPFVATLLGKLAGYYDEKQDFAKGISLLERSLAISQKALGEDHPQTIDISRTLAWMYHQTNDVLKAEELAQRAVDGSQKILGPEHHLVAKCLHTLGLVTRDRKKAEQLLRRALMVAERTLGAEHTVVGVVSNSLGQHYLDRGDYQQAEPFLIRSQAIKQRTLGPENIDQVVSLHNLGMIAREKKDYAKAEEYYRRAIAIVENAFGPDNPRLAIILNNIANIYRARGEYAKSVETHLRVLRISETNRGPYHPLTLLSLGNIAKTYAALGNITEAIKFQSRVDAVIERNIQMNLTIGSERQKLSYLHGVAERTDRTISLNCNLAPNDGAATSLAALVLLQRKGRVLDAISESFASLRQRATAQERALIEQYNKTTAQLAQLVLNGPQSLSFEEHQKKVSNLEEEKEQLEDEISRRSAEFRAGWQPVTLAAVQSAIPAKAALIEFAVYRPFDPKAERNAEAYKEPRYVAYVIRRKGEVLWHDLGDVREIDQLIDSLRQVMGDPLRRDVREVSRSLDEKVMRPVRTMIGDATQLLLSPDGALNLIPFEVLVDEQGRYLVQRYSFAYLTSGRDLLRMQVARESKSKPLVVANPSFGEPGNELLARANTELGPMVSSGKRRAVTTAADLSEVYFAPLSGTAREAHSIQKLFPEATLLTGAQATESALKQVAGVSVLHIATHGFFLSEPKAVASSGQATGPGAKAQSAPRTKATGADAQATTRAISAKAKIENPLLRSGLALAGANVRGGGSDDGILTALEASGLNLWGTKLVVLSACDTGLGEVRNGEGVYGLRRAFVLAGAESLLLSLWPVSDYSTRTLMTNYYKNLKQGLGRGAALRQVQLEMLKRNRHLHPFYWANFIQSGEWASLDGKR